MKMNRIKKSFSILLLVLFSFFLRSAWVDQIPGVINGDESGSIIHPLEYLLRSDVGLFDLTHDGSVTYAVYLPQIILFKLFGSGNSYLLSRLSAAVFGLLSTYVFYLTALIFFPVCSSLLLSLAFSTSYWLVNVSRMGWFHTSSLFAALLFIYFFIRAKNRKKITDFILLGLVGGWLVYQYMGMKIFLIFAVVYFLNRLSFIGSGNLKSGISKFLLFWLVMMIVSLPFLFQVAKHSEKVTLRAESVSLFKRVGDRQNPGKVYSLLPEQILNSLRGFIFFDRAVSHNGLENGRIIPALSCVNPGIVVLFWLGFTYVLVKKKNRFLPGIYLLQILILQIPTISIPSWSRSLGMVPIIYLLAGYGLELVFKLLNNNRLHNWALVLVFVIFSIYDINVYFAWANSFEYLDFQKPYISVTEFPAWQERQIEYIKAGKYPFNYQEWREMEKSGYNI